MLCSDPTQPAVATDEPLYTLAPRTACPLLLVTDCPVLAGTGWAGETAALRTVSDVFASSYPPKHFRCLAALFVIRTAQI